jgi:hypothetical protein
LRNVHSFNEFFLDEDGYEVSHIEESTIIKVHWSEDLEQAKGNLLNLVLDKFRECFGEGSQAESVVELSVDVLRLLHDEDLHVEDLFQVLNDAVLLSCLQDCPILHYI